MAWNIDSSYKDSSLAAKFLFINESLDSMNLFVLLAFFKDRNALSYLVYELADSVILVGKFDNVGWSSNESEFFSILCPKVGDILPSPATTEYGLSVNPPLNEKPRIPDSLLLPPFFNMSGLSNRKPASELALL